MPLTQHQKIMGGYSDITLSKYSLTKHAFARIKERNISIQDIEKSDSDIVLINQGRVLITAYNDEKVLKILNIVMETPKVLLMSNGNYVSEILCKKNIIGILFGKNERNLLALKELLKVELMYDGDKIKIECNNLQFNVFGNRFLSSLVENIEKNEANVFRIGVVDLQFNKKAEYIENIFATKIFFFKYDTKFIFYTFEHIYYFHKLLDFLNMQPSDLYYYSSRKNDKFHFTNTNLSIITKINNYYNEKIALFSTECVKEFLTYQAFINYPLYLKKSKIIIKIAKLLDCTLNIIDNKLEIIAENRDKYNLCVYVIEKINDYADPKKNKHNGLINFGKITIDNKIEIEKDSETYSLIFFENNIFYVCYWMKSINKILSKIKHSSHIFFCAKPYKIFINLLLILFRFDNLIYCN